MKDDLKTNEFSDSIVKGQVPNSIKILKMLDPVDSLLSYFPEIRMCIAYINSEFLSKLHLRRPVVEVYPILPNNSPSPFYQPNQNKSQANSSDEIVKFKLQETKKQIRDIYFNPLTGEYVVENCMEAPSGWFNDIGVSSDSVYAIIKSVLYHI